MCSLPLPLGHFDWANAKASGTTIEFDPPPGLDAESKRNFNFRHQCITAVKEYENKSMEVSFEGLCV